MTPLDPLHSRIFKPYEGWLIAAIVIFTLIFTGI